MGFDLPSLIKVFSALFAIMNPTANLPVFLSPTRGASDAARRRMAAPFVAHGLSPRVTAIAQRLTDMILAAMAVDVMMASLRASFPGLT